MTGATVAVHFINHTIAAAAQLKQMLHISNDNYFEWRFGNIYYTKKAVHYNVLLYFIADFMNLSSLSLFIAEPSLSGNAEDLSPSSVPPLNT